MDDKQLVGVSRQYNNGNFKEAFAALNYPCKWFVSEYRYLPMELIKRLQADAAKLVFLDPSELSGLHEAHLPYPPAIPKTIDEQTAVIEARIEGEQLIPAISTAPRAHGDARLEWEVFDFPCLWQEGEIRELPQSTINRLTELGYKISIDPEEIKAAPTQGVFKLAVKNWRETKERKAELLQNLIRVEAVKNERGT